MEVLSQSQIDDLLNSLTSGDVDITAVGDEPAAKKVKEYDFKTPKRFTKENLKIVNSVYENYSRQLSTYLTSLLRLFVNVELVNVEELRYSEFSNAMPDSVMFGMGEMIFPGSPEENNIMIMDISRATTFAVIERLLGGSGDGLTVSRDFTEIEISLMDSVFKGVFPRMSDAWASYFELDTRYRKIETNSRLAQGIAPDETVVIIVLDILVKETQGNITICVPAVCLEDVIKKINSQYLRNLKTINSASDKERQALVLKYLSESELELRGIIGEVEVSLGDVVYLNVGDILQLNKPIGSPVSLYVGESCWFKGAIGVQRRKKAIRIAEVL
ncbi:flagellar motor switch protein FliM [Oscillospiraceae bacterium MB08-C2-2]|nr:flagellar motor switch protein FliM [Oscillospiraceae bacterium MB08-C2-2]